MNGPLSWQLMQAGWLQATWWGDCQTLSAGNARTPSGLAGGGLRVSVLGEGTQRPSMPLAALSGACALAVNQQVLPSFRLCEMTLISSNSQLPAGRATCLRQMALTCAVL